MLICKWRQDIDLNIIYGWSSIFKQQPTIDQMD